MGYRPSPRLSFDAPTAIREGDAVNHVWGDEEAGFVGDRIYVSSQLDPRHRLRPPSPAARSGTRTAPDGVRRRRAASRALGHLVLANPETGEVEGGAGERLLPSRHLASRLRVRRRAAARACSSRRRPPRARPAYARTRLHLQQSRYAVDGVVGALGGTRPEPELSVFSAEPTPSGSSIVACSSACSSAPSTSRPARSPWLRDRRAWRRATTARSFVYVTRGALRVEAGGVEATLSRGDAFVVPAETPHRYAADGALAEAVFGVVSFTPGPEASLRQARRFRRPPVRCQRSLPDELEPSDGAVSPPELKRRGRDSRPATEPLPSRSIRTNGDRGRCRTSSPPTPACLTIRRTRVTGRRPDARTNTSPRSASAARGSNLDAVVLSMWFTSSRIAGVRAGRTRARTGLRRGGGGRRPRRRRRRSPPASLRPRRPGSRLPRRTEFRSCSVGASKRPCRRSRPRSAQASRDRGRRPSAARRARSGRSPCPRRCRARSC